MKLKPTLFLAPEDEPPATPAAPDPAPAPAPEKQDEEEEEEETPATPAAPETTPEPAAPDASAPVARLSAFDRTALRLLGKGDLISRLETTQAKLSTAEAALAAKDKEISRLAARIDELGREKESAVAAATKAREGEVNKKLAAELASLGLEPEAAPSQLTADQADKTMTRAEFEKLPHAARNEFMAAGGKITG